MTTLMFPIGHCLGTYYFGGSVDEHVQQVRLGDEIVELSDDEFAVWAVAHGLPDDAVAWDRAGVEAVLAKGEISDVPGLVDGLLDRRLLAEVDVHSSAAVDFARGHRLLPLHLGLGNSAEVGTMFAAGTTEQPLVGMTSLLYQIWLSGPLVPNLLTACADQTASLDDLDREGMLGQALASLHALLTPGAACLDLAMSRRETN